MYFGIIGGFLFILIQLVLIIGKKQAITILFTLNTSWVLFMFITFRKTNIRPNSTFFEFEFSTLRGSNSNYIVEGRKYCSTTYN